jgi:transcriptional regulator with XRE-family HTH domain
MMVLMDSAFSGWLNGEVDRRGWSLRHAAERGGISHTAVIRVANGQQPPTYDVCMALARAFSIPPETVLRMGGLLPSAVRETRRIVYETNEDARLLALWRGLAAADQVRMLDLLERLQAPVEARIIGAEVTDESG